MMIFELGARAMAAAMAAEALAWAALAAWLAVRLYGLSRFRNNVR